MNKKTILVALLTVCLLFSLCSCSLLTADKPVEDDTPSTTTTTTTTTTQADDGKVTYTVKVQDETGAPVTGVMVQICKDACVPAVTDANGVATWTVAEDTYKVSFANPSISETYVVEEEYYFEDGSTEMTITITALNSDSVYNDVEFQW